MTDESNVVGHKSYSSIKNRNNNNSESDNIIAEAAKILLKNCLNGTNATAAATLLSAVAAVTFQLPVSSPMLTTQPAVSPTRRGSPNATALLDTSTTNPFFKSSLPMATVAAANSPVAAKGDIGVIEYALTGVRNNSSCIKSNNANHLTTSRSNDTSSQPIITASKNSSYGGRLQFFKDGKFILELARSKDGEKNGWVSVPRKSFRTPSAATSATVTPTSAATISYPKNENSTSLSFSDDNSSIQSSPWQRDHIWKQARPQRGISKEMLLYYQRPRNVALTYIGLKTAVLKRRRPFDVSKLEREMFQVVNDSGNQNSKQNSKEKHESESTYSSETLTQSDVKDNPELKENKDNLPDEIVDKQILNKDKDCDLAQASLESQITDNINIVKTEHVKPIFDTDIKEKQTDETTNGKDKNDEHIQPTSKSRSLPFGVKAYNKNNQAASQRFKKQKTRTKLSTIIQKLINNAPTRKTQASKTILATMSSSSYCGVNNHLNHALTHKVSPPATSRLVEYHQQHVSPRKRILREFEKVSLEDTAVNSVGAGGKRSRAKSGQSAGICVTKSSPPRYNNNLTGTTSSTHSTTASSNNTTAVSKMTAPSQSTLLNSSYSINSLLAGTSNSSPKKAQDQPATIISNVHQQHLMHTSNTNSYQRSQLLSSPKSPGGVGKSTFQSNQRKRSPTSPMNDVHSRSPSVPLDYGRCSPSDSYKSSLGHHLQHSYCPPQNAMPLQFSPSITQPTTSASTHIPHSGSIVAYGSSDLSPPRSLTASPRENIDSTFRTVFKKTSSIRHEFASPSASSTISGSPPNEQRNTSSPDHKSNNSLQGTNQQHLQRGFPNTTPAAISPLHYYMYPPQTSNGGASLHHSQSISSCNSNSAAVVAAASAYIPSLLPPSLYHPYISTLAALRQNPLWLHHYQTSGSQLMPSHAAAVANSSTSRLSTFHPFAYNGVAGATGAVAYSQPLSTQLSTSSLSPTQTPGAYIDVTQQTQQRQHMLNYSAKPGSNTYRTAKMTDNINNISTSTSTAVVNSNQQQSGSIYSNVFNAAPLYHTNKTATIGSDSVQCHIMRDEHSSDVPLNLSKH